MKPYFQLCALLTYALLCGASIVPRRTQSNDIKSRLRSFGIPLVARQEGTCLSEEECGEGMLCVQPEGEPFCKTDCDGFCLPEELAREAVCNCELPCRAGTCVDLSLGEEQSGNGLCSMKKKGELFKCPGQEQEDASGGNTLGIEEGGVTPGGEKEGKDADKPDGSEVEEDDSDEPESQRDETKTDTEDEEDESDSTAGQDGDENSEEKDGNEEEGPNDEGEEQEQTEEENGSEGPSTASGTNPGPADSEQAPTTPETSEETVSSPETESDDTGAVCISTKHLSHLPRSSLVFQNDVLAPVLCDASGSCATAGHMVEFRGRGMMMRRYCDEVGCVKEVMKVNSPVYQKGMRVGSSSGDMSFTGLAARFETVAEEAVLAAAVRVGL